VKCSADDIIDSKMCCSTHTRLSQCIQAQSAGAGASGGPAMGKIQEEDSDDEVPDLVETFDETA
jgi:hypothetical protein